MIWGGLFGQYPKIEQNGFFPSSLDVNGDKNVNVKAGTIKSISCLCWFQYFILKVKIRQSIRRGVTSKWLTRQNSLMSGYKGGTPSDLFVSITLIITLGVPLTIYFHWLSQNQNQNCNLLLKDIKTLPRRMLAADSNMNVDCVDPLGRLCLLIAKTLQTLQMVAALDHKNITNGTTSHLVACI